jgi:hypothetical protein
VNYENYRHPLPITRYPSLVTRYPSPATRGKCLPCKHVLKLAGHGGNAQKGQGKCLLLISSHFSTRGSQVHCELANYVSNFGNWALTSFTKKVRKLT